VTERRQTRLIQSAILILLLLLPIAYVEGLNLILPRNGTRLEAGFIDNTFNTAYSDFYQGFNLTSGWEIDWTLGQNSSAGISCSIPYCVIVGQFSGQRQGLEVSRSLGSLSTMNFHYLLMNSTESTSSLSYSVALTASDGSWRTAPLFHTSSTIHTTYIDLNTLFPGPASRISVRFTDDLNSSYDGGTQSMTIYSMQFAASPPQWQPASSYVSNASIAGQDGILTVSGTTASNLPAGTSSVVSAQRSTELSFDPTKYNIMSVELRASTPGLVAKVVLWNDNTTAITVFSGAVGDTSYHPLLIDLRLDPLGPMLYQVELSWMSSSPGTSFQMQFRNLAFYMNAS
jgi:hypothetical protein